MNQNHRVGKLNVYFDAHEYTLTEEQQDQIVGDVETLARQVERFPFADLRVVVEGYRSNEVMTKLSLIISGQTLVASDHDAILAPAFERALSSLTHALQAHKAHLGNDAETAKHVEGTHGDLLPDREPNLDRLNQAIEEGDYTAFRAELLPYEESLRKRVGRWIQRYPDFEARIGHGIEIADVVEDVFLTAFDEYSQRPEGLRFGQWLEHQIDPAIRRLKEHPDEALENLNLVRSARSAPPAERG